MKKILKIECKRAFLNIRFWMSLLLGCGISLIHILHNVAPYAKTWNESILYQKTPMQYPTHVFEQWMCGNSYNLEGFLFFMIFPLLVVFPYSLSFLEDKRSGYVRQIYTRSERDDYLRAKFLSVFWTGGCVMVIPLVLNFAVCAAYVPALLPQNAAGTLINTSVLWYTLYETHPLLYVLLYLVIDFIAGGLTAVLPLFFSFFSDKKPMVLLMPFIIHIFTYSVCMMTGKAAAVMYSPTYFLFAGGGCPNGWLLVIYVGVYLGLGGLAYWKIGNTEDVF